MKGLLVVLAVAVGTFACRSPVKVDYPTTPVPSDEDNSLGPGDVFEVRVFQQEDMSNTYVASAEGSISFPLIGTIVVRGKTPTEVEAAIRQKLSDGYIVNPQVSVLVKQYNSKKVSVFGQVQKPGTMPFSDGMTIIEAISRAGGLTGMAKKNEVSVTRNVDGKKTKYTIPVEKIGEGKAPTFYMRPGDVVFVKERLF